MGFQVGKECYSTEAQAADAFYSAQPMSVTSVATTPIKTVVHFVTKDPTYGWINAYLVADPSGGGTIASGTSSILPSKAFPTCTYQPEMSATDKFLDGNTLGWGVALAMVGAWAIHAMRRGL